MFGQPRDHPHGGPPRYNNGHFPGPPVGMTAGAPYQPPFARGRGGGGGGAPGPYHFPHFPGSGLSQGYPPSHRPPPSGLAHPPPLPGSPPSVAPPPPPPLDASVRSGLKGAPPPPPPAPKDAEMLKNIEVLSSFVARNGPWFEKLTRDQHGHNPKFAFLFGGERGTEAAIGSDFYEWKKLFLIWEERSKLPSAEHLTRSESSQQWNREELGAAQLSHEVPPSPSGSDMDMEDDFAATPPTIERKPTFERRSVVSSPKRERKSGFSSGVELPSQASERRVGPASPGFERRSRFSSPPSEKKVAPTSAPADRTTQGSLESQVLESKAGASSSVPVDQEPSQQGTNVWNSASSCPSDLENLVVEREKGSQVSDTSKAERESAVPELPRRRDSRRRTGFDRPCMEDVSPQSSPPRFGEPKENQRDSAASFEQSERKCVPRNGHPDVVNKPSRWGPPESGPGHHGNRDLVSDKGLGTGETSSLTKGHKRSEASHHRGEESLTKDRSQSPKISGKPPRASDDISARDMDKPKSRSVSESLAVDEFGRLLRQGSSDSDGEGHHGGGKKRRRSMSRSRTRSRSPGDVRRKRWSPSRSPRRRGRRSRSWSGSPRRQRSRSRTPPREGRWAGEGRGDRGFSDRGGRRWGRGGGPPNVCNDFLKGRCQRGGSCRFLHEESNGFADDQGGRWSGGRGRGRGRGRSGREAAEDGDRNWAGKSGELPRSRKPWNSNDRNTDDDSREKKLIEDMKKQEAESSSDESWERKKGDAAMAPGSTATAEQGVSTEKLPLQSDKESAVPVTSQHVKSSADYMCEALSPSASFPSSQSNQVAQQTSGFSNLVSSPQQPSYPSPSRHQYNSSLNAHVPQHPSLSMSPSALSQQLKYTIGHSHQQQHTFPSSQQSGYSPNVPHKSGFGVNRPPQQPTFTPPTVTYSGNPSMPSQQPLPFASLPMLRPQLSFSSPQQQNFAPLPLSLAMSMPMPMPMSVPLSSGHTSLLTRTLAMNTPPQMLQAPTGTNLTTRLGYSWTAPAMGPAVSYGLPPQQPLQPPPPPPPPQPQTQAVPSQAPPSQVSVPPPIPYQYAPPLPPTYAAASYSTIAAQVMAPSCLSSSEQYDPLADSLEPGPPGAGDKKGPASFNQNRQQDDGSRQTSADHWKLHAPGENTPLMTNAGEVVLENVSPGLPSHVENVRSNIVVLENVSPRRPMHMVMENVSPTNVGSSFNVNASSMNYSVSHQAVTMESVSPCPDTNPTGEGQRDAAHGSKEQKKKDKDGRILNLIRKAVAEHVKDLLKPTWKEGQMSKDAFKTIAKKAVDKVMGALEAKGSIPKSQEKLDLFMDTSKPKIAKLVQGYVDKYVKA